MIILTKRNDIFEFNQKIKKMELWILNKKRMENPIFNENILIK